MPWWWFYGTFFQFGISPGRAFLMLVVVWFLGFGGIKLLDENDLLRANVSLIAQAATMNSRNELIPILASAKSAPKLPCRDAIAPSLYAAELMIPVLNLHQEGRCEIREQTPEDDKKTSLFFGGRCHHVPHFLVLPLTWEYFRAVYILVATVVTSLAVLTFSGIARRWEQ